MDKVRVYRQGSQVEIDPTSLPDATTSAKGALKQADGVAVKQEWGNEQAAQANSIIKSLRTAGSMAHNKFSLIYSPNAEGVGNDVVDDNEYTTGQSATIKFRNNELTAPSREGYAFLGWSTNASAGTAEYPYDPEEQQTYTVTFTNDDIVLYAVWSAVTYTLTYSLGEYGQGSVPSAQTAPEGTEIEVSMSPYPTVNDGSGRAFIGWSTTDGGNSVNDVEYELNDTLYIYDDITLYPVFAAEYTLTYALGNDATGTVPSAQTAYNGSTLLINFNPSVSCISDGTKVFIGWSTTDESSVADYSADGTNAIHISSNVTLYPVFAAESLGDYITIDNTNGGGLVTVCDEYDDPIETIPVGTSMNFNFTAETAYHIQYAGTEAEFDGVYQETQYSAQNLNKIQGMLKDPSDIGVDWYFYEGDNGTLLLRTK